MLRRWLFALLYMLTTTATWASAPADDLSFQRRRWTQEDGAPTQSGSITQTSDGLMWFASPNGLYSFDGIKFQRHADLFGEKLLSPSINTIRALPQGGMAIGYLFGGISLMMPGGSQHYLSGKNFPVGMTKDLLVTPDGKLYALTSSALVELVNGAWVRLGGNKLISNTTRSIHCDPEGTLWIIDEKEIFARRQGQQEFVSVVQFERPQRINFFNDWLHLRLPNGDFIKRRGSGETELVKVDRDTPVERINNGPNGAIIGAHDGGIARMAQRADGTLYEAEFYPPAVSAGNNQGSGGWGIVTKLDRDGNLWRTTYEGVEKFRLQRFHQVKESAESWMVQRGLGDEMWMGAFRRPLVRLLPDGTRETTGVITPGALLRAAADQVWVGNREGLWEFRSGADTRHWAFPDTVSERSEIQALSMDGDGKLLVAITRAGLWRFDQGVWTQDQRLRGLSDPTPITMLRSASGQTWLGLTNNRLGLLTADRLQLLPAESKLEIGNTLSLLEVDGRLLAGGDMGLFWIAGERVHPLKFLRRGNVSRVTGMVVDRLGQLWIHCNEGLLVASPKALAQFWRAPEQPLETELFDFQDGVIGTAVIFRPLPSLSLDSKGRVYYATSSQAGWIDPAAIRRNPRAPDVIIQSLHTADGTLRAIDGMTLPGHPTAVDIAFTAGAVSIPERVRLKYKLEGVDAGWQEVQRERTAHYTNLAPGRYHFKVIAANEDGVWNLKGETLRFEILPTFWQTVWFKLLCGALLVMSAALAYRWRIATIRRRADELADERAAARLEATLHERGRIARSLHDNLLQAVQALLMRFHSLQHRMPQEPDLQSKLDKVLDYAQELVESTRDEVMALRRNTSCEELFSKLKLSLANTMPGAENLLHCSLIGAPLQLQEEVVNELFYVLREAVWNSARHAQASNIAVTLRFDAQVFEASVSDDGIGIDEVVIRNGVQDHWGIVGMRERIGQLGGQMAITAGAPGVTLRFTLPAHLAYKPQNSVHL